MHVRVRYYRAHDLRVCVHAAVCLLCVCMCVFACMCVLGEGVTLVSTCMYVCVGGGCHHACMCVFGGGSPCMRI